MIKLKQIKAVDLKADHQCYLIENAKQIDAIGELADYKKYLKGKLGDDSSEIVRLISNDKHKVVVVVKKKKDDSESKRFERLRKLGNQLAQKLNAEKASSAGIHCEPEVLTEDEYLAFIEGILLGNYQFDKYKSEKKKNSLSALNLSGYPVKTKRLAELSNVVASNFEARSLINEPVITLNTLQLSKEIKRMGKKSGFSVKILNKAEIEKLKMGGLLGVNLGSVDPPIFAIMEWKPEKAKNKKPYILVGKGVVFDTGGYNIKTGSYMPTMKSDMSGAAAVIGTMNAVASNKLPVHVIGLVPATDNRINGKALVPDDIITMHDGSTVEVLNTDAEGRLILADALAYAKQYKPELVIDLATLTGAAAAITGSFGSAMMGTADDAVKNELKASGDVTYERLAEMPYWDEYKDLLKSTVADLKNIGGPTGGAITAGKFLEHFTDYPWIHLDIAGPAFIDKSDAYKSAGGTGVGVRLLYHFLKSKSGK